MRFFPGGITARLIAFLLLMMAGRCFAARIASYGEAEQAIDVCQLNLAQDNVRMFWRGAEGAIYGGFATLDTALRSSGESLICATNAGIYGKDLRPIGLYIESGKVLRKLNTRKEAYGNFYVQPNGVFLLEEGRGAILTTDEFAEQMDQRLPGIRYATQSGPIMLKNGQVNAIFSSESDNRVVRNAVCVVSPGEIALARSRAPISFYDFALALRSRLGCRDALYLDGSVSRLYPNDKNIITPAFAAIIGATAKTRR